MIGILPGTSRCVEVSAESGYDGCDFRSGKSGAEATALQTLRAVLMQSAVALASWSARG